MGKRGTWEITQFEDGRMALSRYEGPHYGYHPWAEFKTIEDAKAEIERYRKATSVASVIYVN